MKLIKSCYTNKMLNMNYWMTLFPLAEALRCPCDAARPREISRDQEWFVIEFIHQQQSSVSSSEWTLAEQFYKWKHHTISSYIILLYCSETVSKIIRNKKKVHFLVRTCGCWIAEIWNEEPEKILTLQCEIYTYDARRWNALLKKL